MKDETARLRVARGAALLDRELLGWHDLVNKPVLMEHTCYCVLGQVEGSYYDALRRRFPDGMWFAGVRERVWAIRHGFYEWVGASDRFEALERAWTAEIQRRRDRDRLAGVAEILSA